MKSLLLIAGLALVSLSAGAGDDVPEQPALREFVLNAFATQPAYHHGHGNAKLAFFERFGVPRSIEYKLGYGRDPTAPLEFLTWIYEGLTFWISGNLDQGGSWLDVVELTNPSIPLIHDLSVGQHKDSFLAAFDSVRGTGPDGVIRYEYDGTISDDGWNFGVHARVILHVDAQDRVEKIRWEYFAD